MDNLNSSNILNTNSLKILLSYNSLVKTNSAMVTSDISDKIYNLASTLYIYILESQIDLVLSGQIPADPSMLCGVSLNFQLTQYILYLL